MSDPDREERKREYNRLAQREFRKLYLPSLSSIPPPLDTLATRNESLLNGNPREETQGTPKEPRAITEGAEV